MISATLNRILDTICDITATGFNHYDFSYSKELIADILDDLQRALPEISPDRPTYQHLFCNEQAFEAYDLQVMKLFILDLSKKLSALSSPTQ